MRCRSRKPDTTARRRTLRAPKIPCRRSRTRVLRRIRRRPSCSVRPTPVSTTCRQKRSIHIRRHNRQRGPTHSVAHSISHRRPLSPCREVPRILLPVPATPCGVSLRASASRRTRCHIGSVSLGAGRPPPERRSASASSTLTAPLFPTPRFPVTVPASRRRSTSTAYPPPPTRSLLSAQRSSQTGVRRRRSIRTRSATSRARGNRQRRSRCAVRKNRQFARHLQVQSERPPDGRKRARGAFEP